MGTLLDTELIIVGCQECSQDLESNVYSCSHSFPAMLSPFRSMSSQSCQLGTLEATFCVYSDACGVVLGSGEDGYSMKALQLRRELLSGVD